MTLNPDKIDSIHVIKGDKALINKNGEIHIILQKNYIPSWVTLEAFKDRYLTIDTESYVFMLNGKLIKGSYNVFQIDSKYILKAEVDQILLEQKDIDLSTINLITRSADNVKKANTILIRGMH